MVNVFVKKNHLLCPSPSPSKKIQIARLVCQIIPASCPFTQNILLFGHTLYIPPLCKLNPFYNYLMGLRWQALNFLAALGVEEI